MKLDPKCILGKFRLKIKIKTVIEWAKPDLNKASRLYILITVWDMEKETILICYVI